MNSKYAEQLGGGLARICSEYYSLNTSGQTFIFIGQFWPNFFLSFEPTFSEIGAIGGAGAKKCNMSIIHELPVAKFGQIMGKTWTKSEKVGELTSWALVFNIQLVQL